MAAAGVLTGADGGGSGGSGGWQQGQADKACASQSRFVGTTIMLQCARAMPASAVSASMASACCADAREMVLGLTDGQSLTAFIADHDL